MSARMALLVLSGLLGAAGALPAAGPPGSQPAKLPGLGDGGCPSAACAPDSACPGRPCRTIELDASALLWWTKSAPTPALVSTSAPADLGILGTPTGRVLIGGRCYDVNPHVGARLGGRYLFNETLGVDLGGLFLENGTRSVSAVGAPIIAVPFLDPADGANTAIRLAAPGAATGSARVRLNTFLWGLEANGLARQQTSFGEVDLLAGFRFLQLGDGLGLETRTTTAVPAFFAGAAAPAGSTYVGLDSFRTLNSFYGGQIGARARAKWGFLTLQARASVALGTTEQTVNVNGSTTLLAPGAAPAVARGSVFAQTTNIGQVSRHRFAVVPQGGLTVGCQVTEAVRVGVGYDFLYWSSVARAGDQVDRQVNPNLPPILDTGARGGAVRPVTTLNSTDFWAQGVSFTVELAF